MTKIDKWRDADGRTADPYAGLRAAIEGLPKVRQWFAVGPPWGNGDFIVSGHPDPHIGKYVCDTEDFDGEGEAVLEHAAYIAAANPAAIRTLLAERDSLAGEVARLTIPEGMALVPIEPTPQMLARSRWSGSGDVSVAEEWARREVWARMVAAAAPGDDDPGDLFAEQHAGDFGTAER